MGGVVGLTVPGRGVISLLKSSAVTKVVVLLGKGAITIGAEVVIEVVGILRGERCPEPNNSVAETAVVVEGT